ncbi:hypothetical protein [Duganella sp. BuS-21]|uniref:hypothetical protein n=1 Tax=Duganella sp. BuS-21 TaxID=2943848 RepID=UPI0035A6CBED
MRTLSTTYRHRSTGIWAWLALGVGGLGLALVFALIATSGSPLMVGMAAALIVGPLLLLVPELTIWILLVVGLVLGVLTGSPKFSKLAWGASLLSMLLLPPAIINMMWSQERRLPAFMKIAVLFLVYAVLVTFARWYSLGEFIAGFKRYFQAFGLMLALSLIVFPPEAYARWKKFVLVVALLQLPFAAFELFVLVPMRGGLAHGSEATDVVAGTFGANLDGGSPNAVMVMFLFIALAFLVARWRAGLLKTGRFVLLSAICLAPLGFGETKIAVVMLPLVGVSLLRKDLMKAPLRYVPALLVMALLTMALGYIYVVLMMKSTPADVIANTLRYNVGDQGYSQGMVLNRFTSITFWFARQGDDLVSFLIGNGLGSSFSSLTSNGHVALKYLNYGINMTAVSTLLWDVGMIGCLMFISMLVLAWFAAGRLHNEVDDAGVKADALAIQAALVLFGLQLVYADSIVNLVSLEIVVAIVLGYLSYLMNLHGLLRVKKAVRAPVRRYA